MVDATTTTARVAGGRRTRRHRAAPAPSRSTPRQCGSYNPTQGITDTTIKLGSSFPQSGLYQAYAKISKGYLAYFNYINDQGGVNGRKIEVVTKDDAYDPAKTEQNVARADAERQVFAFFNIVGTPNNVAIRDDTRPMRARRTCSSATGSRAVGPDRGLPVADRFDPVVRDRVGGHSPTG